MTQQTTHADRAPLRLLLLGVYRIGAPRRQLGRFFAKSLLLGLLASGMSGCGEVWNDPYPAAERGENILYSAFTGRPKHLDPAVAYSEDEYTFIAQIYEPPLQYHYLKRPYELIPGSLASLPKLEFFDAAGKALPANAPASAVARTVYELTVQANKRFAPHPAFSGELPSPEQIRSAESLYELAPLATRELRADDFIYAIKRLAHPRLHSPIGGMMMSHIEGLKEFGEALAQEAEKTAGWIDLDQFPLSGVQKIDEARFRITVKGKYPQFAYWLAMPFFAPIPREAERFYALPGMAERNWTMDWFPVGTGPYQLTENNPNARMVLTRNPHFAGETYPAEGEAGDAEAGLLADAGRPIPFIDQAVFTLEKEAIPYWTKFLQGYYDASGISSDSFDQAVRIGSSGDVGLTDEMRERDIQLLTSVRASTFYMGFNMLDSVVGGLTDPARKLRQAISIALDQEEFIAIFMNGRGEPAMSPLPPGIFGYQTGRSGINPYVYDWVGDGATGQPKRKSVAEAKRLLAQAGYPNGRHHKTGEPLVVNLDTTGGGMGEKARLDWLTRQFAKIDVQLVVRSTDFNRFQEKLRKGAVQMYYLGWNADYPDPENFFFLLHGQEARVPHGGENSSNYQNPRYDRLFARMKNMDNTPERLKIIQEMIALLQQDAPWVWGFYPKSYSLGHGWLKNRKPNNIANNTLKYQRLDPALRQAKRDAWNSPVVWPLWGMVGVILLLVLPAWVAYRRREQRAAV